MKKKNAIFVFVHQNDRLTGNGDMQASTPFPEATDEDQHDSKTSIVSPCNRDILSRNEGLPVSNEMFFMAS